MGRIHPGDITRRGLVGMVIALTVMAGVCIVLMMGLTCVDIVLRFFGHPIKGVYDLVQIAGALTIACSLPYTSALAGHVSVEFFYLKLKTRGRLVLDSIIHLSVTILFVLLAVQCIKYGASLHRSGEVTPTLELPIFWVMYAIAFSAAVVALVSLYRLANPRKALMTP